MTLAMRLIFAISAVILLLDQSASACSVPPTKYPWIPKYEIYSHFEKQSRFEKFDFVGIVTADLEPVEKDQFEYYYGQNSKASIEEYAHIKFEVSDTVKGHKKKYFYHTRRIRDYSMDAGSKKKNYKIEKTIIRNPKSFKSPIDVVKYERAKRKALMRSRSLVHFTADFKDILDMSYPQLKREYQNGMCGNEVEPTIFLDMSYLAFVSDSKIVYLEPINLEQDPFVEWVKDYFRDNKNQYLSMSFPELFRSSHDSRYGIFEITECPTKDEVLEKLQTRLPFLKGTKSYEFLTRKHSYAAALKYAKFDMLIGNVTQREISMQALEDYMFYIGVKDFQCDVGSQYFAFARDKNWDHDFAYAGYRSQPDKYNWRFMRIENEHILMDDFITNLDVNGPKKLHLSELVK